MQIEKLYATQIQSTCTLKEKHGMNTLRTFGVFEISFGSKMF